MTGSLSHLAAALGAFLLTHSIPALRPVRARCVALLGERGLSRCVLSRVSRDDNLGRSSPRCSTVHRTLDDDQNVHVDQRDHHDSGMCVFGLWPNNAEPIFNPHQPRRL